MDHSADPFLYVLARRFSQTQTGTALRCYSMFLAHVLGSVLLLAIYKTFIIDRFADATAVTPAPLLELLCLRAFGPSALVALSSSYTGLVHHTLVEESGVEPHR